MNSANPGRWMDRLIGWCFGILAAAIALYCAVKVLEAIWPALIVVIGAGVITVLTVRIVVHFASKSSW